MCWNFRSRKKGKRDDCLAKGNIETNIALMKLKGRELSKI